VIIGQKIESPAIANHQVAQPVEAGVMLEAIARKPG
jgi:hypothetical protein